MSTAARNAWVPAVLGCSERAGTAWAKAGLHVLELGDEAVVQAGAFSLDGRSIRGIRQAVGRGTRACYSCEVRRAGDVPNTEWAAVRDASGRWRVGALERGFSLGLAADLLVFRGLPLGTGTRGWAGRGSGSSGLETTAAAGIAVVADRPASTPNSGRSGSRDTCAPDDPYDATSGRGGSSGGGISCPARPALGPRAGRHGGDGGVPPASGATSDRDAGAYPATSFAP